MYLVINLGKLKQIKILTDDSARMKVVHSPVLLPIHPVVKMKSCTNFHGDPSKNWKEIFTWNHMQNLSSWVLFNTAEDCWEPYYPTLIVATAVDSAQLKKYTLVCRTAQIMKML